jgi:glycosyltransferase involved in cell wall biosynthesis
VTPSGPRVVHLVAALFDDGIGIIGGGERYALELARHMAERTPTRLVTFGPVTDTRTVGNLRVDIVRRAWCVSGRVTNSIGPGLFRLLRNADVIHCYNKNLVFTRAAAAFGRFSGKRVFVTDLGGSYGGTINRIGREEWFHRQLHISRFSEDLAGDTGSSTSEVILGGVDATRFVPSSDRGEPDRVLFVGRLLPHKGVDTLIAALPSDMCLEVVGRPYDATYYRELRALATGKRVAFLTDIDDANLVAAYQRAACVVLPSVYTSMYGRTTRFPELLGQTLLEGMACAKPVICSSAGSMPELVEDGVNGFVVPPGNVESLNEKLRWIRDHPDSARSMGAAGRERALTMFSWESVVDRCLNAYALG